MRAATNQGHIEIDLGFWAKLMAPMGWGAGGRVAKAQGLIARARAESDTNASAAIALYTRAIDLLNSTQGLEQQRKALLGPAELGRGRLREAAGDSRGAVDSYLQARQLLPSLPLPALSFTAAALARRGDASETATALYLELLRTLKGRDRPSGVAIVYESLEERSIVTEGSSVKNETQVALCRRVSVADPDLEWPYYNCGLESLNRSQFADAIRYFERCKALRSTKPLVPYYLAFSKGMDRANGREWEQAAVQLREACRVAPQKPEAQFWLGKCLLKWCESLGPGADCARYSAEAIAALTATPSERRNREDAFYLGSAYLLAERFSEAERWLETAAQADSKNAACFLHLGLCRQKLGKLDKAASAARSAIALDSDLLPAHRLLATVSFASKDYETAQGHFQVVVMADPTDRTSREQWGFALYFSRRWKEAVGVLRPLSAPSDSVAFVLARCLSQTDSFQEAAKVLRLIAQKASAEPQVFYFLGLACAHLGQWQDSVKALDRALDSDQGQVSWYLHRGHVYSELGNSSKASADYERALKLEPDNVDALYCLGRLHLRAGEIDSARANISRLVKLAPKHLGAVLALGAIYERMDSLDSALMQYAAAVALDSNDALARRCLGVVRFRKGDQEGAWKDLQQAVALGDDSDELLYYYGLAAIAVGQLTMALKFWSKLRERHSADQRLGLNLGRLRYMIGQEHAKAGRFAEAVIEWECYLESRPEDECLKRELAKLYLRLALKELPHNPAAARDALQKAAAHDPDCPVYEYYLTLHGLQEGKWDSYITTASRLLPQLVPSIQLHAKYHLGIAHLAKGEFDKASELFKEVDGGGGRQAVCLDTSLPNGFLHARANRWAEAADVLIQAIGSGE